MHHTSVDTKTFRREYASFNDAKQRCNNPKHKRYNDWGGRGIRMCFQNFQEFIETLGPRPMGMSLDRINNDGDYCSSNVKWSTRTQQQHNKRVYQRNSFGIGGVRSVKAKGLITATYQAYMNIGGQFIQLYTGPDFFEACCARKSKENEIT